MSYIENYMLNHLLLTIFGPFNYHPLRNSSLVYICKGKTFSNEKKGGKASKERLPVKHASTPKGLLKGRTAGRIRESSKVDVVRAKVARNSDICS